MCPVCLATIAWVAAGATSTGGLSALVVSKLRRKDQEPAIKTENKETRKT
jgi:hypothetical protein